MRQGVRAGNATTGNCLVVTGIRKRPRAIATLDGRKAERYRKREVAVDCQTPQPSYSQKACEVRSERGLRRFRTPVLGYHAPTLNCGARMEAYYELKACRVSGSDHFVPVLNLGQQALTGVFPRSADEQVTRGPLELVWCPDSGLLQLKHTYNPSEM